MLFSGNVEINAEVTVLDGWRGMLGHNWGSEHAHQWIWLRGAIYELGTAEAEVGLVIQPFPDC